MAVIEELKNAREAQQASTSRFQISWSWLKSKMRFIANLFYHLDQSSLKSTADISINKSTRTLKNSFEKVETGVATLTNKDENQDYYFKVTNTKLNLCGIIVADGLGSYTHAQAASKLVTKFVCSKIEELKSINALDFEKIFLEAKEALIQFAHENDLAHKKDALGTTLIVAVHFLVPEQEYSQIKIAYVGNGAVWHLRGNFNHFDESQLLPWNAVNYLNPHTIQEDGKEALYKLISTSSDKEEAIPTVVNITVDNKFGDIIMICTDGIYSFDQVRIGKDNSGSIWISGERSMDLFFSSLSESFKNRQYDFDKYLLSYLNDLNGKEILDDDATIGLLITDAAFMHQKKLSHEYHTSQ